MRNPTPQQLAFITEYLDDDNATQAAIRAGYSAETARVIGPRLRHKKHIAAIIEATYDLLHKERREAKAAASDLILRQHMAIAFADVADYVDCHNNIIPLHDLAPELRVAIRNHPDMSARGERRPLSLVPKIESLKYLMKVAAHAYPAAMDPARHGTVTRYEESCRVAKPCPRDHVPSPPSTDYAKSCAVTHPCDTTYMQEAAKNPASEKCNEKATTSAAARNSTAAKGNAKPSASAPTAASKVQNSAPEKSYPKATSSASGSLAQTTPPTAPEGQNQGQKNPNKSQHLGATTAALPSTSAESPRTGIFLPPNPGSRGDAEARSEAKGSPSASPRLRVKSLSASRTTRKREDVTGRRSRPHGRRRSTGWRSRLYTRRRGPRPIIGRQPAL